MDGSVVADEHEPEPNRSVSATEPERVSRDVLRRRWYWAAIVAVMAVATVLRAAPLTAGLPYTTYRDEGHVLGPAERMVSKATWDPHVYQYPSLLIEATAVSTRAFDLLHGSHEAAAGASEARSSGYYDIVEPKELIVVGRLLVLLSSVGTVLLSILLATRLAGRRAGIAAGLIAASLPALVTRGSIVIVDTPAALFATATLLLAAHLPDARHLTRTSIAAGVAAGLAFTSKYPAGLCILVVLVVIAFERKQPRVRRLQLALTALGGAAAAAILTMPALVLRLNNVLGDVGYDSRAYQANPAGPSYLRWLIDTHEVGWVLLTLAAIGLVVLARSARWRPLTLGFVASTAILYAYLGRFGFQPFRNLLPAMPFLCVSAAVGIVAVSDAIARRRHRQRSVARVCVITFSTLLLGTLFFGGLQPYLRSRLHVVDSRVRARQWLQGHTTANDRVLVAADIAFLPTELRRIHAHVVVLPATTRLNASDEKQFGYIVVGSLPQSGNDWVGPASSLAASLGSAPTPTAPGLWRGNRETIRIFRQTP